MAAARAVGAQGSGAGAGGAGGRGRQHWGAEVKAWALVSAGVGDGAGGAAGRGVLTRGMGRAYWPEMGQREQQSTGCCPPCVDGCANSGISGLVRAHLQRDPEVQGQGRRTLPFVSPWEGR